MSAPIRDTGTQFAGLTDLERAAAMTEPHMSVCDAPTIDECMQCRGVLRVIRRVIEAVAPVAQAQERARILTAADQMALGPSQGPSPQPMFEECRRNARRLLGDASDWIRSGNWRPLPTLAQRDVVRRALSLISEAEDALDEAASVDTIDLDGDDQ